MKNRNFLSAVAVLAVMLSSPCLADEPASLIGEWVAVSATSRGQPRDTFNFDGMRWIIGKDELEITPGRFTPAGLDGKVSLKCSYSVDDSQSPAHFNWTLGEGDRKATVDAIYELKEDVLRVCFGRHGQPRPSGFETKGTEWSVYTFKRSPKD